ncbi:MAG: GIY-YIG nuclease family protein [Candidatus Thiodiazotropha sp. (ex Monitilora ramsayi)]|nr:GIY-YIG nuclease family protein [Candidatus Thiodiazotropha sp. (ex Monitilora ramsayi)]
MTEIVYVLINEAMPNYAKIGRTDNLEQRIRSLDNTSVPLPFECFYAARVNDAAFVEKQLHDAFADFRVRKNREYFEVSPDRIVSALKIGALEEVTPGVDYVESEDDQKALDKARTRRSAFNFEMVKIPEGAELQFVRDESVTCKVVGTKRVEFQGETTSLSAAASSALNNMGLYWKAVQGPMYWLYEGETLGERRYRLETSDE